MNPKLMLWKLSNVPNRLRGWRAAVGQMGGLPVVTARLDARVIRADGKVEDYGTIQFGRVVTTAGVNYIVDAFQNTTEVENFKYHGMGTGSTAESSSDTALGTEVESRATGSQTEGSSANIYSTVGTITATTARAVTEHGIFSASSSGTLLDRSVFSAINLANGDSIQFTYQLTVSAGG